MLKFFNSTKQPIRRSLWQDLKHALIWTAVVFVGSSLLAMLALAILVHVRNH